MKQAFLIFAGHLRGFYYGITLVLVIGGNIANACDFFLVRVKKTFPARFTGSNDCEYKPWRKCCINRGAGSFNVFKDVFS